MPSDAWLIKSLRENPQALAKMLDAELARRSFHEFVKQAWPVIEPALPLADNWHIAAICQHLEAVTDSRIKRLLINIPPGHAKSLLVSVFWPAWIWLQNPGWRGLFASYAMPLAIRDSVRCRDLITSQWYQETFRPAWTMKGDQNVKSYFENDVRGLRLSLSVGSHATGFRGDCTVVDDPINAIDATSELARAECVRWWDQTMSSRLNDQRTGTRVIIMQRLHEDDLSGHVLRRGGYDYLCLPSEFEPATRCQTSIGWQDPRTELGEPLFPEMFPREVLAATRTDLGAIAYAGQHQQRPMPDEGGMFKRVWLSQMVDAAPVNATRVRYWDKAGTEGGTGARTAGVKIAKGQDGLYYIEHVIKGRWSAGEREQVIKATAEKDKHAVEVWVEQEPGSGGKESAQATVRNLAGFNVYAESVTGDKMTRARPFAAQCEAGNIRVVRDAAHDPWVAEFLDELTVFPLGRTKDQVDAAAGAFNKLAAKNMVGEVRTGGHRDAAAGLPPGIAPVAPPVWSGGQPRDGRMPPQPGMPYSGGGTGWPPRR